MSEQRRAEILRDNIAHASRQADAADLRCMDGARRGPLEDEDGFVAEENYRPPGMAWKPPADEVYREGGPLSWLMGEAAS